jgi:hypothetical protein
MQPAVSWPIFSPAEPFFAPASASGLLEEAARVGGPTIRVDGDDVGEEVRVSRMPALHDVGKHHPDRAAGGLIVDLLIDLAADLVPQQRAERAGDILELDERRGLPPMPS